MHDNPFSPPTSGPVTKPVSPTVLGKTGLGGWLIVLGLSLIVSGGAKLFTLVQNVSVISSPDWQLLITPGSPAYDPLWNPAVWTEIVLTVALLGLNAYVIFLYFSKRAIFPRVFTIFAVSNVVVMVISLLICMQISNFPADAKTGAIKFVFQSLTYLAIWGTYVQKSQRVKGTFVR